MPSPQVCDIACRIVDDVVQRGYSLDRACRQRLNGLLISSPSEVREISWGAVRWYFYYKTLLTCLLRHPIRQNDKIIEALLVCGLYQLDHLDEPDYAIVSSTVQTCRSLQREHSCGLVNAVLRRHQRQNNRKEIKRPSIQTSMPVWLANLIEKHWPNDWLTIAKAYNEKPPLTLRVNNQKCDTQEYLKRLKSLGLSGYSSPICTSAITLKTPLPVNQIPGFSEGHVSIQDLGAQLTPLFTGNLSGCTVLDAGAAPGGKTCHLLESRNAPLSITSLDFPDRTEKIEENLLRLKLNANVIAGDATQPSEWWAQNLFDCIIIDAPCSATGVIRRHPDIRVNRRESDIIKFRFRQVSLLRALWALLRPGGRLVYITCSILPPENDDVIGEFLEETPDSKVELTPLNMGVLTKFGRQLLPEPGGPDGFYYAALKRISN